MEYVWVQDQGQPSKMAFFKFGRKALVFELLLLLCIYIVLCPAINLSFYERILFFPDRGVYENELAATIKKIEVDFGASRHDQFFTAPDGKRLHGWLFETPKSKYVIIVSHGNAGNIAHRVILAEALIACGASVFLYDYEGYGDSDGQPSIRKIGQDGVAAFDYLVKEKHFAPGQIISYGESLGTGVACEISKRRSVGGIILQSGFPSLIYAAHDRIWFTWLYPSNWFDDLDNLSATCGNHAPLLIIHGMRDPVLPERYAEILYEKASHPKRLVIIEKFGHCLETPDNAEFLQPIKSFLSDLASAPGGR